MRRHVPIVWLVLLSVLAACAGGSDPTTSTTDGVGDGGSTSPSSPAPPAAGLHEVLWLADTRIERDVASPLPSTTPARSIRFKDDGTLAGFSGCNSFQGPYELDGDRVLVRGLAGTLMACSGATGDLEQFITAVIADPAGFTYRVAGDRLTIETDDGRGLGFSRSDEVAGSS